MTSVVFCLSPFFGCFCHFGKEAGLCDKKPQRQQRTMNQIIHTLIIETEEKTQPTKWLAKSSRHVTLRRVQIAPKFIIVCRNTRKGATGRFFRGLLLSLSSLLHHSPPGTTFHCVRACLPCCCHWCCALVDGCHHRAASSWEPRHSLSVL